MLINRHYRDPRFDAEPFAWLVAFAVALAVLFAGAVARSAPPNRRPVLWIYTDPSWCPHCRSLDADLKRAPMNRFRVVRLAPPEGTSAPYIYWRDGAGKWQSFAGWAPGEGAAFMKKWQASLKSKGG